MAAGITLYNFMRGLPYKLVAHNIGNVDSIGNAVFLAADERYACPHSTFMFHGVGFDNPARRYEWKDLDQMMDSLMADEKRIADIICERSAVSEDEAKEFFMLQQTKSAEFARERGVIHEIRDLSLPLGAPVLSLVFQR